MDHIRSEGRRVLWPRCHAGSASQVSIGDSPYSTSSSNGAVFGTRSREDNQPISSSKLSSSARLLSSWRALLFGVGTGRVVRQRDFGIEMADPEGRAGTDCLAGKSCLPPGAQQGKRPVTTRNRSSRASNFFTIAGERWPHWAQKRYC